jgi:hypothetical protein
MPTDFGTLWVILEYSVRPVVVQACVAAFDAAGGRSFAMTDRVDEDESFLVFKGLSVLRILVFFSGLGVLTGFFGATGLSEREKDFDKAAPSLESDLVGSGRLGKGGGRARSGYFNGRIVPLPSQVSVSARAGGRMVSAAIALLLDSLRLCSKAPKRSTRSLHCSSNSRNDACNAFSVSDFGR